VIPKVVLRYLSDGTSFQHSGIIIAVLADGIRQTTLHSLGVVVISDAISFFLRTKSEYFLCNLSDPMVLVG
jgi:hypothetical protein